MTHRIDIGRGMAALIDDADVALIGERRWHARPAKSKTGVQIGWYVQRHDAGGTTYLHRVIMGAGPGQLVDHIDGDGLNNTRANLRICTRAQNNANRVCAKGSSGYRGVHPEPRNGRWYARIEVNGRPRSLGCFATPEEAARAYDAGALAAHGEFARLNFPNEHQRAA
jgi:hypothetical protein